MKSVRDEIRRMHAFEPDVRVILPIGCAVDLTRFTKGEDIVCCLGHACFHFISLD